MKKYIITRTKSEEHKGTDFMKTQGYIEYIKKHGYHFTEKLANHAADMMKNAQGVAHRFSTAPLGATKLHGETDGDLIYIANMAYADFYPNVIPTIEGCLEYAKAVATDPDGYEGMEFMRWTTDLVGKPISINWEEFV